MFLQFLQWSTIYSLFASKNYVLITHMITLKQSQIGSEKKEPSFCEMRIFETTYTTHIFLCTNKNY